MNVSRLEKRVWIVLLMSPVLLALLSLLGARWATATDSYYSPRPEWPPDLASGDQTSLEQDPATTDFLLYPPGTTPSHSNPTTLLSNSEMTHTVYQPLCFKGYCPKAPPLFGIEIDRLNIFPELWASEAERARYEAEVYPDLLEALKDSGASWTRIMLQWCELEPVDRDPGEYAGWSYYDAKLAALATTGSEIIVIIHCNPSWAASTACGPIDIATMDEFLEMLSAVVNRYKDPPYNVRYWEVINEPDSIETTLPGIGCWGYRGAEYVQLLQGAYGTIKAADPQAQVLMGGIAYDRFTEYGGPFYRYFIDDVLENGGGDYFDFMNFHYFPVFHAEWDEQYGYAYGKDLIAKGNYIKERMGMYGVTKPLMCTELAEGGHAWSDESLQKQANYVVQGNTRGMSVGLESIVWYALITYDAAEQGLLYDDLTPKPAYYAYQILVRELEGATYLREFVSSDPYVEGYVFRMPCGEEKTVLWATDATTSKTFPVFERLRVVTRDGDESIIVDGATGDLDGLRDGQVTIEVSGRPIYVQADP